MAPARCFTTVYKCATSSDWNFKYAEPFTPAVCHGLTRWSISGTDMKNYTSYSSPLNSCTQGECENARPMGLRRTHVNSETGKARAESRVPSHQEGTYAVYWSMSQSHQCTSRTEIPYTLCSIFKASGQCSTNAHLSVYISPSGKCKEPIWPCRNIGYNFSLIHSWIWNCLHLVGSFYTAVTGESSPAMVNLSFQVWALYCPSFPLQWTHSVNHSKMLCLCCAASRTSMSVADDELSWLSRVPAEKVLLSICRTPVKLCKRPIKSN